MNDRNNIVNEIEYALGDGGSRELAEQIYDKLHAEKRIVYVNPSVGLQILGDVNLIAEAANFAQTQREQNAEGEKTVVQLVNPFSGVIVERDITDVTKAEIDVYAQLLDDETLAALEGNDTPAEWLRAYVEHVGAEDAGRVILGS